MIYLALINDTFCSVANVSQLGIDSTWLYVFDWNVIIYQAKYPIETKVINVIINEINPPTRVLWT